MNLHSIWNYLKEKRENEEIIELREVTIVPNSFKSKEYIITHRFRDSTTAFIGRDEDNSKYHIKVFGVSSFDVVKSIYKNLKLVSECQDDLQIIPVVDIIEFFQGDRWVVLLVSPYYEGFTLEELTESLHSHKFHLHKDTSILIFLSILGIIKLADSKNLIVNTMPDNLFVLWKGPGTSGCFPASLSPFELRIQATSLQWLRCGKSRLEKLYPMSKKRNHLDGMIWGAGLSLYSFVSSKPLSELPPLNEWNDVLRGDLLKFYYEDEALAYMIKNSLKSVHASNFITHPFIQEWTALLHLDWEGVEVCTISEINALLSGLTFENLQCRLLAMRRILVIIQECGLEVYKHLNRHNMLFVFIEMCLVFDWHSHPDLINSVFLILKEKTMSRGFKERLVSMNFISVIVTAIDLKANNELLCQCISKFSDDNTLTLLQIVWNTGFPMYLLKKPNRTNIETEFIKDTMSYYGPNSVEFIEKVYDTIEISENRINQHLLETPFYFKNEKSHIVVSLMQRIIEKNARNQSDSTIDLLKTVVLILAELLCVPKLLQFHHVINQCTSSSTRLFLSEVGRNPLLAKCKQCGTSYCVMCIAANHQGHEIQYINYQSALTRCQSVSSSTFSNEISIFRFPKLPAKIIVVDGFGKIWKQSPSQITFPAGIRLTTTEALNTAPVDQLQTLLYFEVKVNQAGLQENIIIGIDGCEVYYHSTDGSVYVKESPVGKAKKFGSYDTVGIGITSNSKAYVTYNGLVNWPMFDCGLAEAMRPVVIANSHDFNIEIKLRGFLFAPTDDLSNNQDFANKEVLNICERLLELLSKYIKKSFRRNPNDIKTKDLMDKFIEILTAVKKFTLIEKTEVKKSRFWPR